MSGNSSVKNYLTNFKKVKWVAALLATSLALVALKDVFTSVETIIGIGDKAIGVVSVRDINLESELITDHLSVFFVSPNDYGSTHQRIDPFSKTDIRKALEDKSLFILAEEYILVKLRIANINEKIINVEEVRVNLQDYSELPVQDFYQYDYVYSGGANASYEVYSVTLEPGRTAYNALTSPLAFEYESIEDTQPKAPLEIIYHPIDPGYSEFIALKIIPGSPGIYKFNLSVKYSIDGRDYEMPTSQVFRIVNFSGVDVESN